MGRYDLGVDAEQQRRAAGEGRRVGLLARALLVGAAYLAFARYSALLHAASGLGAVFWPSAGVTVAALLVSPRRWWPVLLATVGLVELGNNLVSDSGVGPSAIWALGNMVEPLLAAWLVQRWEADRFEDVGGVVRFSLAAVVAAALGGAVGSLGTVLAYDGMPYLVAASQWLVGDGIGILTVVPFALLLARRLPVGRLTSAEGAAAILATGTTTVLVFGFAGVLGPTSGAYLVLLPLVWVAARLRVAGAAVGMFLVAQVANGYHAFGYGPFVGLDASVVQGSAQLKLYLATVTVTVLLLACRSAESEAYRDLAATRAQLVAAVSHELRTPLTAIVGFSETLVQQRGEDPLVRQASEAINRNGRHLADLVEELLQASRARQGTLAVAPEPVRLAPFLDELLADRVGQGVRVAAVAPDLVVLFDPTHLTQVVTNLVDNALRHGRAPVEVTATALAGHVEVAVTDDGDGVDAAFLPYLFDEFVQAVDGDRRSTLGLGLGLSIARAVARANGGDVVHRPSSRGACFVVRLPLPADDVADMATSGAHGQRSD